MLTMLFGRSRETTDEAAELQAARDALLTAETAVGALGNAYREALEAEATGTAPVGSALAAKSELSDGEHARDLAAARVDAFTRAAEEARRRALEAERVALLAEEASLAEQWPGLGAEATAALASFFEVLDRAEALNAQLGAIATRLHAIGAVPPGHLHVAGRRRPLVSNDARLMLRKLAAGHVVNHGEGPRVTFYQ